jgi:single-stranded-DNA-specific exonuclease
MSSDTPEKSLMQIRWQANDAGLDEIEKITRQYELPEIVARILCARGVPFDDIDAHINPTLKDHFPDPFSMAGMVAMASDLAKAIADQRKIAIFGDFDVDGATSSAILHRFLAHLGIIAPIYIPDRLTEGYGPNEGALRSLRDEGAEILIMLDCGTTSHDVVKAGRDMGLEIYIFDHHKADDSLPEANHVINPMRADDTSGLGNLAACGVTFMACVALRSALQEAGYFEQAGLERPQLESFLDLVALGTVCDMVPLTGVNRLFVRQGLELMKRTQNLGLQALLHVSKIDPAKLELYHLGYDLGPRINAGSRVDRSDYGAQLLSTEDREDAENIAWALNDCNDQRKEMQRSIENEARHRVQEQALDRNALIMVGDPDWSTGLNGLVAGMLVQKYKKPACVFSEETNPADGTIEGRGSARSVPGIDVGQALLDAASEGVIIKGGGHAMAGGFTFDLAKRGDFEAFLNRHIEAQIKKDPSSQDVPVKIYDGALSVRGASVSLIKQLRDMLGPFGQGNDEPVFMLHNVKIFDPKIVGKGHVSFRISDQEGSASMKAIAFGAEETPLGTALMKYKFEAFHFYGYLKIDHWQGRENAQMIVKDASFVQEALNLKAAG